MTKEIEERVLQAARDHAIDNECPIHDKWWDEWVEPLIVTAMRFQNQLQSKLTPPADVQEQIEAYIKKNEADGIGPELRDAIHFGMNLAGASSMQEENKRLREDNKMIQEALESIRNPIGHLRKEAEKEGAILDGVMAQMISKDAEFGKKIADSTLKAINKHRTGD